MSAGGSMAKIVFCWECGVSLGHIGPSRPILAELCKRGHNVSAVLRNLSDVDTVFRGLDIQILTGSVSQGSGAYYPWCPNFLASTNNVWAREAVRLRRYVSVMAYAVPVSEARLRPTRLQPTRYAGTQRFWCPDCTDRDRLLLSASSITIPLLRSVCARTPSDRV